MQHDLSPAANAALEGMINLSVQDKTAVVQVLMGEISKAANSAPPATGAKMETALSTALASTTQVKTATHGFSIVRAADGERAVQFIEKLDDGTTNKFQLCKGAQGVRYRGLAQYGNEELKGAKLGAASKFDDMVDALLKAVKGLMVADGKLQTEDEGLKLAFEIVQQGVRIEGGGARAEFLTEDKEGGQAVSGCRVYAHKHRWLVRVSKNHSAFFDVSSPESKN